MAKRLAIILVVGAIALTLSWFYGPAARQRQGLIQARELRAKIEPFFAAHPRFKDVSIGVMTHPSLRLRGNVPDQRALDELQARLIYPPNPRFKIFCNVQISNISTTNPSD